MGLIGNGSKSRGAQHALIFLLRLLFYGYFFTATISADWVHIREVFGIFCRNVVFLRRLKDCRPSGLKLNESISSV